MIGTSKIFLVFRQKKDIYISYSIITFLVTFFLANSVETRQVEDAGHRSQVSGPRLQVTDRRSQKI